MDKNKSILEKALLQVQHLEEAVKQNSKGILKSTMKEELNSLLNETEEEEIVNEDNLNSDEEIEEQIGDEETEPTVDDTETGDEETEDEFGTEETSDDEVEDEISNDDFETEPDFGGEETDDEEDVLDLTNASDEEVLKIYKSMKPEDGVIVKKDGDDVSLEVNDDEFIIKLNGETDDEPTVDDTEDFEDEETTDEPIGDEEGEVFENEEESEETIYEIELSEDDSEDDFIWFGDDENTDEPTGDDTEEEIVSDDDTEVETEVDEASRTFGNQVRKPADHGKKFKAGRAELNEAKKEIEKLKKQNGLYKETIVAIKGRLNEIALFNQKLFNSTKLFTEHSTTKLEKQKILERFERTKSIEESTNLYETISSELTTRRSTVSENVESMNQIKNNKNSSSSELLSESTAYVNPEFTRIKELMNKINK